MAKQIDTVWTKVTETVELEDTGDILMPLKRVSVKYAAKALAWENRAPKVDERKERSYSRRPLPVRPTDASFYREASENVDRIING
jgi:hypothetical protein